MKRLGEGDLTGPYPRLGVGVAGGIASYMLRLPGGPWCFFPSHQLGQRDVTDCLLQHMQRYTSVPISHSPPSMADQRTQDPIRCDVLGHFSGDPMSPRMVRVFAVFPPHART